MNDPSDGKYIPPTYLHCLKRHLNTRSRGNVNERDKRLLKYIRHLQEWKRRRGVFKSL